MLTVVLGVAYLMSSLDDSADRFKKSLQRSQSGPEVKRKAVGATEKLGEGREDPESRSYTFNRG